MLFRSPQNPKTPISKREKVRYISRGNFPELDFSDREGGSLLSSETVHTFEVWAHEEIVLYWLSQIGAIPSRETVQGAFLQGKGLTSEAECVVRLKKNSLIWKRWHDCQVLIRCKEASVVVCDEAGLCLDEIGRAHV